MDFVKLNLGGSSAKSGSVDKSSDSVVSEVSEMIGSSGDGSKSSGSQFKFRPVSLNNSSTVVDEVFEDVGVDGVVVGGGVSSSYSISRGGVSEDDDVLSDLIEDDEDYSFDEDGGVDSSSGVSFKSSFRLPLGGVSRSVGGGSGGVSASSDSLSNVSEGVVEGVSEGDVSLVVGDSGVVMGSSSVSVGGVSEVFNPFLDDDEDDLGVVSETFLGFDGAGELISGGDVSEDDDVLSDLLSDDGGVAGGVAGGALRSFNEVVDSRPLVPDDDKRRLDSVSAGVREGREARLRERVSSSSSSSVVGPRAISSEFKRHVTREVVVPSGGRDDVERGVAPKQGVKGRYRYVREDGRLNGAELQFFKNLELNKKGDREGSSKLLRLRGRVSGEESEAERKARSILYGQAVSGADALRRGSKLRFTEKDRDTLQFLGMFRYATDQQLSRMFSLSVSTMYNRLKRLRSQGLVIDKKLYGARPIWFLTEAGMILSGLDLPRVTESKMSFSMFPHQFTVNNTAANLWGANVNVLNLDDYPERNKVNGKGVSVLGESLVSELEVQSSLGRIKMFDKGEVFNPQLRAQIEKDFKDWERAGGVGFGDSPEMLFGNEFMWAIMPPYNIKLAYHVPDLVVKRPRSGDGSPNSIAVEVEINNKPSKAYEKTLLAYKSDNRMYKQVVWVCKNVGPARKLEQISKEIGLWQDGRIKIVPVLTENGVFKERDLWTI